MGLDYETCRKNLEALVNWYSKNKSKRNEATTRLTMIDRIFFECLSWDKEDAILEESIKRKYADYVFLAPRRMLIVEAKKEGKYFEIPAGYEKIDHAISSLLKDNRNLKQAIEQVAAYCQTRGVPYGAVCNGHQIVIFVANRNDGIAPFEGKAIVFSSLQHMLDNFLDFWQTLSKPAIQEKKLQSKLIGDLLPDLPPKLSSSILQYPGIKNRNIFQTDLQIISELVIEDITRSPDLEATFLKECYCQSGALSQYALVSRDILQARYAAMFDSNSPHPTVIPATSKKGISPEILAASISRRPILLIGDVGVGKTIFIRNLIKIEAKLLLENAFSFYLDFGSQATLTDDFKKIIVAEIATQLLKERNIDIEEGGFVRRVYKNELDRFSKSVHGSLTDDPVYRKKEIEFLEEKIREKAEHLKNSLLYISKSHNKQIIIFLDNADQREDRIQQEIFLISQELAAHWPVAVFVTLRPETFYLSIQRGALSGYHAKAFTISPPRVDLALNKRMNFALKLTSGEISISALPEGTRVKFETLGKLITVFLNSMEKNNELIEFIDNVSNGNIRLALDLVRGFFGSGHVDTQKIVDIYNESKQYIIPLHEFIRAVIYGDNEHYSPERSPIANLFDISYLDGKEHFLLPLIVGSLFSLTDGGTEQGFVETHKIYERLQGAGFTPEQIDIAIIKGYNKKLIESSARRIPQKGRLMPEAIRATTDGVYHIVRLCFRFVYLDAMIVDTPILDSAIRDKIRDSQDIFLRLERAKTFCEYLDSQWGGLKNTGLTFDWAKVSIGIKEDIEFITKKLIDRKNIQKK